jgi:hypothetical protein
MFGPRFDFGSVFLEAFGNVDFSAWLGSGAKFQWFPANQPTSFWGRLSSYVVCFWRKFLAHVFFSVGPHRFSQSVPTRGLLWVRGTGIDDLRNWLRRGNPELLGCHSAKFRLYI